MCLNVLREDWMPSIDLSQVACSLQYLLSEPNPTDPLNEEAANLLLHDPKEFEKRVKLYPVYPQTISTRKAFEAFHTSTSRENEEHKVNDEDTTKNCSYFKDKCHVTPKCVSAIS